MMCVFIYVWFCFYLFLYCMHVYCKYVCCLLSIHQPINVGPCIFITFYAVSRYAVSIYVFSLLYVHSTYVIYLFTCIDNSLSCIGIYLVLFGFSRYVCELICYCHSENSGNFTFLRPFLVLLLQVFPGMLPTNWYHGIFHAYGLRVFFFFFFLRVGKQSACRSWSVIWCRWIEECKCFSVTCQASLFSFSRCDWCQEIYQDANDSVCCTVLCLFQLGLVNLACL